MKTTCQYSLTLAMIMFSSLLVTTSANAERRSRDINTSDLNSIQKTRVGSRQAEYFTSDNVQTVYIQGAANGVMQLNQDQTNTNVEHFEASAGVTSLGEKLTLIHTTAALNALAQDPTANTFTIDFNDGTTTVQGTCSIASDKSEMNCNALTKDKSIGTTTGSGGSLIKQIEPTSIDQANTLPNY